MQPASRFALAFGSLLAALALPVSAPAQERRFEGERGNLTLGMFVTDRAATVRVDSAQGPGSEIDLEDDLGLESSTAIVRLGGGFWFKPRQRVDFSVYDLSRDATRTIDRTIEFGDQTFTVNTTLTTDNDVRIAKLDYTFAALHRERGYLGIGAGFFGTSIKLSMRDQLGEFESDDLSAPLPVVGLRGEYAITERITLRGANQWFGLDTGKIDGQLIDFYVGADYRFGQRVALGLAYNAVSIDVDEQDGRFDGAIDVNYDGVVLYFKVDFGVD